MNGIYRTELAWTETKLHLDRICAELNLEWSYDPGTYMIMFRRQDSIEHDLETCFGNAEYQVTKEQVMWGVGICRTQESLEEWLGK